MSTNAVKTIIVNNGELPAITINKDHAIPATSLFIKSVERGFTVEYQGPKELCTYSVKSLAHKWGPHHWNVRNLSNTDPVDIHVRDEAEKCNLYSSYDQQEWSKVGMLASGACVWLSTMGVLVNPPSKRVHPYYGVIKDWSATAFFGVLAGISLIALYCFNQQRIKARSEVVNKLISMTVFAQEKKNEKIVSFTDETPLIVENPKK